MSTQTSKTYTAQQKLERAFLWIMKNPSYVAYTGVLMVGNSTLVDQPGFTARTDGKNVEYGREFVDSLTEQEVRFLILHENLHKTFRHLHVWKHLWQINPFKVNCAADYVINDIILESSENGNVVMPAGALHDPKYKGMDTQQVFHLLPDSIGQNGSGGDGSGFDEHDWEGAQEMSTEEVRQLAEQIDSAIRQGAILAGKLGGQADRLLGELMDVPIDYRTLLEQFVSDHCRGDDELSWRRPSRRSMQFDNMYRPSSISESVDQILIAVDTSGSIDGPVLTEFVSNVIGVCNQVRPARVDLLYWDSEVAGHETYFGDDVERLRESTKPKGGGGTSPSCIPAYMTAHKIEPSCIVVLSDGYVDSFPTDWNAPVLWVLNSDVVPPSGMVARI
jgi:predicted metal-dependent peptidase